jgi:predicted amino acid dehydrogenase
MTRRFTFLVHPLVRPARWCGAVRSGSTGVVFGRRGVQIPYDVGLYARVGFGDVEGWIMGVPLLPDELLADQSRALDAMERAVQLAAPVRAVGLGSVLSVVAGRGEALSERCGLPVTTGNAATAWAATSLTRRVARERGIGRVAVVGGKGAVGRVVASLLRDELDVFVDPEDLRAFPLVVGANTTGAFLPPDALSPTAILVDVSLPRTLSGPPPPRMTVLAGELVALPPGWRRDGWGWIFHVLAGYGVGGVYACLLEPLILAQLGRTEPFAQGRRVEVEAVREFGRAAEAAGFRPVARRLAGAALRLGGASGRVLGQSPRQVTDGPGVPRG